MKFYQGFTLIEVLISLLLVSVGLLALTKTQLKTIILTNDSFLMALGQLQGQSMVENLIAKENDSLAEWNRQNQYLFPGGKGTVSQDKVRLSWLGHDHKQHKIELKLQSH